jgi:uncharacterized protein (DUF58 family)
VIRLTGLGVKALLFWLLLLGAFFATNYFNLLFLLVVFLTVLGTLNLFWTWANLTGVEAAVVEPDPVPAGAGGMLRARVAGGRRRRIGLCLVLDLEGGVRVEGAAAVVRGESVVGLRMGPLRRGLHSVRRARLASNWPLGLCAVSKAVAAPSRIVVFPAPAPPGAAPGAGGEGAAAAARARGLLQPSGLRDYRPSDEPRSIHWRASACRGSLVVKEWEGGLGEGVEICIDRRAAPEALEHALSVAAALALAAREAKERLVLHSQGLSDTFGRDHRSWNELLVWLAGAEALPPDAAPPPPVPAEVLRLPAAGAPVRP